MSKQGQGTGAGQGPGCKNDCGFDATNPRHQESAWEAVKDPRDSPDNMKFTGHYYKTIDRQISENHHTGCLGKPGTSEYAKK